MPPVEEQSDIQLMLASRDGDTRAFTALHARHQRRLLGFYYGLSGNAAAASDLTQEAFLRVWRVRRRYRASGAFVSYLFAIARLVWLEHCRRERGAGRLFPLEDLHAEPAIAFGQHPDARAHGHDMEARILAALDELPEEQRMVFVLRHVRGLSIEETAAALDCPVNTVRSRRILALRKLRTLLAPYHDVPAATGRTPEEARHEL